MKPMTHQSAATSNVELPCAIEALLGRPRLRENVWRIRPDAQASEMETLQGVFEVETARALAFMRIRSHCTPHNSLDVIATRSGVSRERVIADLFSLVVPAVLVGPGRHGDAAVSTAQVADVLMGAASLWGRELSATLIANHLCAEVLPRSLLQGWLLEMYH